MISFKSKKLQKYLALITIASYIGFLLLGFFHLLTMTQEGIVMTDCPFEHILTKHTASVDGSQAIKDLSTSVVTVLSYFENFILLSVVIAYTVKQTRKQENALLFYIAYLYHHTRKRGYHLYQQLLSQGILNPKPY